LNAGRLRDYRSWGGTSVAGQIVAEPYGATGVVDALLHRNGLTALAFGYGRSYGDVALNPGGLLLDCRRLDRFIAFDDERGVIGCEAGTSLADILAILARRAGRANGWFLPVTPGTRFVTVGGAIANDVHGKNHHLHGTFGRHVLSFDLARGDGSSVTCSPHENPELFAATIGGLGLTGIILRATLKLRRVEGVCLEAQDIRFNDLDGFFRLTEESDRDFEYTAAWIDCSAKAAKRCRGIFSRARHVAGREVAATHRPRLSVPLTPPLSLVNRLSVRAFNAAYWLLAAQRAGTPQVVSYEPVLFPLDAIADWNRLYGNKGFYQFQCAIPITEARRALANLMRVIAASGQASMLTVLKMFGNVVSPGLMSFPLHGATLAVDFANRGARTLRLLKQLEDVTLSAGGRLYPAKDGAMTAEAFRIGYPNLETFRRQIDPAFSSAFAKRVNILPHSGPPCLPTP
jgi:FAD/FMN-containing dehydrogenase